MVMRLLVAGMMLCWLADQAEANLRQRSQSRRPLQVRPVARVRPPVDEARLMRNVRSTWYQAHDELKVTFRKEIMEGAVERGGRPPAEILGRDVTPSRPGYRVAGSWLEVTAIVPTPGAKRLTPILLHVDGSVEELPAVEATGPVTTFDLSARVGRGRTRLRFVHEGGASELAIER